MTSLDRRSRRIGFLVLVVLAGSGLAARADDLPIADRVAIEALGKEIVARLDASEEARMARAEAQAAANRTLAVLDEAERTRTIAEISVKAYLEGTYPQDRETLLHEIKLAEEELARATDWLATVEKQRESGRVSENQVLAVQFSKKHSEVSLSNAHKKLEILEKFTRTKTKNQLELNIKKAEGDEVRAREAWQLATAALARANRRLAEEGVTDRESRAISKFEDVFNLFDVNKAEAALAKLDEAKTLWGEAQDDRAKARYKGLKDRVRAEAKKARAGK